MSDFPYIDGADSLSSVVKRTGPALPMNYIATAFMTGVLTFVPGSVTPTLTNQTATLARAGSISTSGRSTTYVQVDGVREEITQVQDAIPALETRDSLRGLRQRSGLTWDEVARLLGVSRRTVHAWANGSRLNQAHAQRLSHVVGAVGTFADSSPETARSRLLAPGATGISPYQKLVQELQTNEPVEGFRPAELLGIPRGDA